MRGLLSKGVIATVALLSLACDGLVASDLVTAPSDGGAPQVTSVSLNATAPALAIGQTLQLSAVALNAGGQPVAGQTVSWISDNAKVVTVSTAGLITAVAVGTANVKASIGNAAATASVEVQTGKVSLSSKTTALAPGQTYQLAAAVLDPSGKPISGLPVSWSSSNAAVATVSSSGLVTAVATGSTLIKAASDGGVDSASVSVSATAPPPTQPPTQPPVSGTDAELPRVFLTTTEASTPSTGRALHVANGGNLQAALDSALPGDRILLAPGATFTGNYILPAKSGGIAGQWITVEPDGNIPAEGTRMTPALASSLNLPRIQTANSSAAITTAPAAARWRFSGIEVTADPATTLAYSLIYLGQDNGAQTVGNLPTDIIVDRSYVHGTTSLDLRRCIALNGAREAVIDSYVSECHSTSDAQAVAGWNGPGPFKIVNNELEASTENVTFGGADPTIVGLIPSDIEIRRNHIMKPMSLKGGPWLVKNLFELKNAQRVLIDANVLENSWLSGQVGFAFVLWSVNQNGACTWCTTSDLTITNNIIRHVAGAFNLAERLDANSISMRSVTIRNNVVIGLDAPDIVVPDGNGRVFQILGQVANLTIEHNTGFSPDNSSFIWGQPLSQTNQLIRNNVTGGPKYPIFTSAGQGNLAWAVVGGPGSVFSGNVVAYGQFAESPAIPGNMYPANLDGIGLAGGSAAAYSVTAQLADLALAASSPYKGMATDGKDPGADLNAIAAATQGVITP